MPAREWVKEKILVAAYVQKSMDEPIIPESCFPPPVLMN
jgi:hypothetical protein